MHRGILMKAAAFFCFLLIGFSGLVTAEPLPLQNVTFIPQWVPQAQFAGYYLAQEPGLFQQYGLDVTVISSGPNRSAAEFLKEKEAHVITNLTHQAWMLDRMRDIMLPPDSNREMGRLDKDDFQRVVRGLQQLDALQNAPAYNVFYPQPAVE